VVSGATPDTRVSTNVKLLFRSSLSAISGVASSATWDTLVISNMFQHNLQPYWVLGACSMLFIRCTLIVPVQLRFSTRPNSYPMRHLVEYQTFSVLLQTVKHGFCLLFDLVFPPKFLWVLLGYLALVLCNCIVHHHT
jgi:hypothetical protein